MRVLVRLSIAANLIASAVLIWLMVHMSDYEARRNGFVVVLMAAFLGLNLVVTVWTMLNVDNGRIGRLFSLWLQAKERDLERRANPVRD
jgi:uncharacterized membrane protein